MKLDKNKKIIIIVLVILFILFSIIRMFISSTTKEDENATSNNNQTASNTNTTNTAKDEARLKKLKKVDESERIRMYLGKYFKYIEKKDYESAYGLLYGDFKDNYFPTLEKYKEYIEESNYPEVLSIDYKDITREGYYYIVTLDIKNLDPNAIRSERTAKTDVKFVIRENDYDDFYLSFQL